MKIISLCSVSRFQQNFSLEQGADSSGSPRYTPQPLSHHSAAEATATITPNQLAMINARDYPQIRRRSQPDAAIKANICLSADSTDSKHDESIDISHPIDLNERVTHSSCGGGGFEKI